MSTTMPQRITNISTVPLRSPFRYPGGKTWLVPRIRRWLQSLSYQPSLFIEPFAGGAIVGLTVAFEELAKHVILVELDRRVGAVWQALIKEGEGEWLATQIESFEITIEKVERLITEKEKTLRKRAFQTIVHNRVSRGGIIAEGAGLIKNGDGRGVASRWYPETLAQRLRDIDRIRDRLSFVEGDGLKVIERYANQEEVAWFIDPPYTVGKGKRAGRRLYDHSELDHRRLFDLLQRVRGDFLITYENAKSVKLMAKNHGFMTRPVSMKNNHHTRMTELLIGRDLGWLE